MDPDPVLVVLPRPAWDALVGSSDPAVRRAIGSPLQVDTCLHAAIRIPDGGVDDVALSVHLAAAEAVAADWLDASGVHGDGDVVVRSVTVGLGRAEGGA